MTRHPHPASPRAGQPRDRRLFRLSGCGALFTAALAGLYAGHLLSGVPGMIAEARAATMEVAYHE